MTTAALQDALGPLVGALLAAAQAEAEAAVEQAKAASARLLSDARHEAEAILADARRQGEADAAAVQAASRAAARRTARERNLRTEREIYDELLATCLAAVSAHPTDPLQSRLEAVAREILGTGCVVQPTGGGGVIAEAPGRRLDLSMAHFVDQAVAELARQFMDDVAAATEHHGSRP